MTKLKENLLPVAAVILAASLAAFGLFTFTASGRNVLPRLAYTAVAFIAVLAAAFMRESILRIFAVAAYIGEVTLLIAGRFFTDMYIGGSVQIGYFFINPSYMLVLCLPFIAFCAEKIKKADWKKTAVLAAAAILPGMISMSAASKYLGVGYFAAVFVMFIVLRKDREINITYIIFPVVVIASIIAFFSYANDSRYLSTVLDVIRTRGQSDPITVGWLRILYDGIFRYSPLVGETTTVISEVSDIPRLLTTLGCDSAMYILARLGKLPFIGFVLICVLFTVCVMAMAVKTKQSTFARFTSLSLALSVLFCNAIYFCSIFFLVGDRSFIPFFSTGLSISIASAFMLGNIISLYLKRNQTKPKKPFVVAVTSSVLEGES